MAISPFNRKWNMRKMLNKPRVGKRAMSRIGSMRAEFIFSLSCPSFFLSKSWTTSF